MYEELFREVISKAQPTGNILQVRLESVPSKEAVFYVCDYWNSDVYDISTSLTNEEYEILNAHKKEFVDYTMDAWYL